MQVPPLLRPCSGLAPMGNPSQGFLITGAPYNAPPFPSVYPARPGLPHVRREILVVVQMTVGVFFTVGAPPPYSISILHREARNPQTRLDASRSNPEILCPVVATTERVSLDNHHEGTQSSG
jgi:hypothetical protein